MSRIHSSRKGKHSSKRPPVKENPEWVPLNKDEVEQKVVELAKNGVSMPLIGTILRDQHGVPSVKLATGKTISQILTEHNLRPQLPPDLSSLIEKANNLKVHLKKHRKDYSNKRGLMLVESKIRRLAKYYTRQGILPPKWSYSSE
ncbi:MAG: 30S ribosomal protein S15 [Thermoplasmata archaeon]|nr:30S ribosomal protein S15 [Thermoplasmata archaeon]